jgi:hypothetical protein
MQKIPIIGTGMSLSGGKIVRSTGTGSALGIRLERLCITPQFQGLFKMPLIVYRLGSLKTIENPQN